MILNAQPIQSDRCVIRNIIDAQVLQAWRPQSDPEARFALVADALCFPHG